MADFLYHALAAIGAIRSYPGPQPVTWETVFGSGRDVLSGVSVSELSSLDYAPVWSGVSTLSRDIAKLPLVLNRNLTNGGTERFKSHPLYRILHDEWNPEMTSYKARETMQALCLLYGNAYAEIVRDELGRPVGMYPIDPTRVTPIRDEGTGRLAYRVLNANSRQALVKPLNMLHISSLSTDGVIGHGIVQHARESIGLGIAVEKFGGAFFGNGATFGGVVEVQGLLTGPSGEATKNNIRSTIEAVHAGVDRAHKILVLAGGSKFTPRGTAPNEAQMVEVRKFQVTEVARWLNMPAHKLGDLENAHFTNIEEQELQYYAGCVSGWLEMWEQELSRKLIAPLEYKQQSIEHVMEGALRGTSQQRADFYQKMIGMGVFTINHALVKENMNPIGPDGDVHMVPLNMIPLERYGEWIDAQIEAKKAPPLKQLPPTDGEQASDPKPDERMATIQEMMTSLTAGFDQERRDWDALLQKVTGKLDDEIGTHATAADAARQAQADAEARAEADRGEKAAAEQARADLETNLAVAQTALQAALDAAVQADAALLEAQALARESDTKAAAEAARADASEQEQATARAVQVEAMHTLEQREAALAQAHQDRLVAEAATEALQARVDSATATITDLEAATAAATARAVQAAQEAETARLAREQVATAAAAATLDAERIAQESAETRQAMQAETEARSVAEAAAETRRQSELDRLTRVVAAHRTLIVDVMQRLIRPEVDRARRRQVTPESLQKWAEAFYQTHRDVCADALYPAVLTHLAWKRSDENPREAARRLAQAHCEDSERQLQAVINGSDPEEFHANLERMLQRWEAERPQQVADQVLQDELEYIASRV